jgi:adenine-specific DNA-methyltransferase
MNRAGIEKVEKASADITAERLEHLKSLFPEVFTEGKVDFAKLRATLGDVVDDQPERYCFSWAGKRDAIQILQAPSRATLKPERSESADFDTTQNLFLEGDNLEVLKLLRKSYSGQVKMIYIDPPYNTGNDFIYPDNYADPLDTYLKITGQKDSEGNLQTINPETSGRYHSAWLSMMYPRLFLARQLLREDGVIFISINDREVYNLRLLMNEVFGEENFIGMFVWQSKKGGGSDKDGVVNDQEYVVCFGKSNNSYALSRIIIESEDLDKKDGKGLYRRGRELNKWGSNSRREDRPTMYFAIPHPNGEDVYPIRNDGTEGRWRFGRKKMFEILEIGEAEFVRRADGNYTVYEKIRSTDPRFKPFRTWMTDVGTTADGSKEVKSLFNNRNVTDFPKPVALIKYLISIGTTNGEDIVLDFFAGACTTAQAVIEVNKEEETRKRFVCVQLPELTPSSSEAHKAGYTSIAEIGKERIRRVIHKMKEADKGKLPLGNRDTPEDLGFKVFKLAKSNYRQWKELPPDTELEEYIEQLELFSDPLLDGWQVEDVIYEVALKEGYSLTSRIKQVEEITNATVWKVTDEDKGQYFHISLDNQFHYETARTLKLSKDDLLICRDMAIDDTTAANLVLQCRLKTI